MADQDSTLQPGDVIAEYQIEKVLGSGSFGVTYLARDMHLSRAVAIKEYMPVVYARRGADGPSARATSIRPRPSNGALSASPKRPDPRPVQPSNIVRVLRLVQE